MCGFVSQLEIESGGVWVRVPIKTVCNQNHDQNCLSVSTFSSAREVATGRPPPTRTMPHHPLALSFPSPLKSSHTRVFGLTEYLRDLRDLAKLATVG